MLCACVPWNYLLYKLLINIIFIHVSKRQIACIRAMRVSSIQPYGIYPCICTISTVCICPHYTAHTTYYAHLNTYFLLFLCTQHMEIVKCQIDSYYRSEVKWYFFTVLIDATVVNIFPIAVIGTFFVFVFFIPNFR